MAKLDVEWMFGDAAPGAMSCWSSTQWSGSLDFQKAIKQMHDLQDHQEGKRSITVRIPSGITGEEEKCKDVEAAIAHIKSNSPDTIRPELDMIDAQKKRERAQRFRAELEKLDAQKKKEEDETLVEHKKQKLEAANNIFEEEKPKVEAAMRQLNDKVQELAQATTTRCRWMFADAGEGWNCIGLGKIGAWGAHLNPTRWSAKMTMNVVQKGLEVIANDETKRERPIFLKVFEEGKDEEEETYANAQAAVDYLKEKIRKQHPEVQPLEDALSKHKQRLERAKQNVDKAHHSLEEARQALDEAKKAAER